MEVVKKRVYSHSQLNLAEKCDRAYFHKYIEGRPEPSGLPARVGKIFHEAISIHINEGYSPEDAVFIAIYKQNGLPDGERDYFLINMVKKMSRRIAQCHGEHADIFSEMHLKINLAEVDREIQGYLDIVLDDPASDTLAIWDFKTSWYPFSATATKQLPLYGMMYKEMRGGYVPSNYKGILIFPRCSDEDDSEIVLTDEIMNEARVWAVELIRKIEAKDPTNIDDWKMTTNRSNCEFCSRAALCAGGLINGLPTNGYPKDDAEAKAIGEYLLAQELAIKRMKDGLKAFEKQNGPVQVRGGRWTHVRGEANPSIDMSIIRQYAQEHGIDLLTLTKLEAKAIKDLIEGDATGVLRTQAKWSTPRSTFKFVEEA
ncbi:PD-(D/E)XK nuclease family protein [Brevibacillus sp. 179-C9.3 HS]|uniref:PD-(D/E)XK nuclease family protein n=1 Tax=unclassified Brevibacillus TaxID=2684853 RepID=UPI0039A034C1